MDTFEEASRDPGTRVNHHSFTDKDFEDHRVHTIHVGPHVPYHRRTHHRRHRHHKKGHKAREDRMSVVYPHVVYPVTLPSERVRAILGEGEDGKHESHPLFSEMEELHCGGEETEWRETARWLKYEEDVEEGGNRWSKPYVGTISLHTVFELRNCILNGTVMLDLPASNLDEIADTVLESMVNSSQLQADCKDRVKEDLLRRHRHQHERKHDKGSTPTSTNAQDIATKSSSRSSLNLGASNAHLSDTGSSFNDTSCWNLVTDFPHGLNKSLMKKIPPGAETSNILIGEVECLNRPVMAFVRLSEAANLGDLTEVPVPTRFLFMLLGPVGNLVRYHEIGRAMATLMSDEVFHDVAYKAKNREDLCAGLDEFLDVVTVIPPGAWDPNTRIEPPQSIPSQDARKKLETHIPKVDEEEKNREESGLKRSGRLFGGLINDVKRKLPWYLSDFTDAIAVQTVASIFFLYFACLTPIITFGGLLSDATGGRIGTIESLLAGALCGILYGLFSGQPLTILGSTGPVLVFETILFDKCQEYGVEYLPLRLWVGLWTAAILIALVAFDASALVCYITRFTEENFATLISLIFVYKAIEKVVEIGHDNPISTYGPIYRGPCICQPSANWTDIGDGIIEWDMFNNSECEAFNGTMYGTGCLPVNVPDIFLFSVILFACTFVIAIFLKQFKFTPYFPSKIRSTVSDFAVVISILLMTVADMAIGLATPKLQVPQKFQPTWHGRGWVIPFFGSNPWWTALLAFVPALLATILIFMDQQITAVIINRHENKLKKGGGYHLDLFVLALLIIACSVLGLPWFVAATVLAMTHVNSLKMESQCSAPGEKPQFLGVREQRLTQIGVFSLVGLSILFTSVLQHIPMPVLYGVFLYMGVSSLKGSQFFDRVLILLMPQKYQPDYVFLRHVPTLRVHLFTAIQSLCLIMLWIIKSYKTTSIGFPVMLVVIIGVRKLLDFLFTQRELKILDDVMPEFTKRTMDEEEMPGCVLFDASSEDVAINLRNGNISTRTFNSNSDDTIINISEQVAQSGIWQSIEQQRVHNTATQDPKKFTNSAVGKTKRERRKHASSAEEHKRLSTMAEEEDEENYEFMVCIDVPTPTPFNATSAHGAPKYNYKVGHRYETLV